MPACTDGTGQPPDQATFPVECKSVLGIPCQGTTPTTGSQVQECSSCEAGTYAAEAGASACSLCAPGTFQDEAGASSCKACPTHSNSSAGSTEQSACFCRPGFIGDGTSSCEACGPGKYGQAKNDTSSSDHVTSSDATIAASHRGAVCENCQGESPSTAGVSLACFQAIYGALTAGEHSALNRSWAPAALLVACWALLSGMNALQVRYRTRRCRRASTGPVNRPTRRHSL